MSRAEDLRWAEQFVWTWRHERETGQWVFELTERDGLRRTFVGRGVDDRAAKEAAFARYRSRALG